MNMGAAASPPWAAWGQEVTAPITATITRFGLRSPRDAAAMIQEQRHLMDCIEDPRSIGLLKSALLFEGPRTCFGLSIWNGDAFMSSRVPEHIAAARRSFNRLRVGHDGGPELWSTTWRLTNVSNNLNWGEFELRDVIDDTTTCA